MLACLAKPARVAGEKASAKQVLLVHPSAAALSARLQPCAVARDAHQPSRRLAVACQSWAENADMSPALALAAGDKPGSLKRPSSAPAEPAQEVRRTAHNTGRGNRRATLRVVTRQRAVVSRVSRRALSHAHDAKPVSLQSCAAADPIRLGARAKEKKIAALPAQIKATNARVKATPRLETTNAWAPLLWVT